MFGRDYEEIGSSDKGLILKGNIKIQWGNKLIDLLDSDGNLNVKVQTLIKEVQNQSEIKENGFYYLDGNLYSKIDDNLIELTSKVGNTYVSFLEEQKTSDEQKYTALKNIGFIYKNINDKSNIYPKNGIIYSEKDQKLYVINNGQLSEYLLSIPNPFTEQFVIERNDNNSEDGALLIKGEGRYNGLKFDSLILYSLKDFSIFDAKNEYQFLINGFKIASLNKNKLEVNSIQSQSASDNEGYRIYNDDNKYILDIDKINVREPLTVDGIKYNIPNRIYNEENIILNTYIESNNNKYVFKLKYPNTYIVGDIIKIYIEHKNNYYKELIPIQIVVTESYVNNIGTNIKEQYYNSICSNAITTSSSNYQIANISNVHCFLYQRKNSNNELIKNQNLIIGELEQSDKYNDKNDGIISKQNIFYSAKFEKEGTGVLIFPFYAQDLTNELNLHYKEDNYENIIPPIKVVNNITDYRFSKLLKQLLTSLNNWNTLPSPNTYLYYNGTNYEWKTIVIPEQIELDTLLDDLNSQNPTPSSEGYLHYNNGTYDWQMPSGGGGGGSSSNELTIDNPAVSLVYQSGAIDDESSFLTLSENSTTIKANQLGTSANISINTHIGWKASVDDYYFVLSKDIGEPGYSSISGFGNKTIILSCYTPNFTFNDKIITVTIKNAYYDSFKLLEKENILGGMSLQNHYKTFTLTQLAKKELKLLDGITEVPITGGDYTYKFSSSFRLDQFQGDGCSMKSDDFNENNETITLQIRVNDDTQYYPAKKPHFTIKTTDGQTLIISYTMYSE